VPDHTQDPARVSDETLRSFETDLPKPESHDAAPATPLRRQGALILVGMVAVIAVGVIALLAWLL
jgi:hypothetical protein